MADDDATGEELPTLGYATPHKAERLLTIRTFNDSFEAHLAAGKLRAEGIPCTLADENIVTTGGGMLTTLTGGIKLQVNESDHDRALAALPTGQRQPACPSCGSADLAPAPLSATTTAASLLLLGLPLLFIERDLICRACGHHWREGERADEDDNEEDAPDDAGADKPSDPSDP